MIGQTFGSWLVVDEAPRDYARQLRWRCVCSCGQSAIVYQNALKRGTSTSCGCSRFVSPILLTPTDTSLVLGAATALYGRRPTLPELSAAMRASNRRRARLAP